MMAPSKKDFHTRERREHLLDNDEKLVFFVVLWPLTRNNSYEYYFGIPSKIFNTARA